MTDTRKRNARVTVHHGPQVLPSSQLNHHLDQTLITHVLHGKNGSYIYIMDFKTTYLVGQGHWSPYVNIHYSPPLQKKLHGSKLIKKNHTPFNGFARFWDFFITLW